MFEGRPVFVRITLVAAAGVSCLAAVACGSSTTSSGGAAPSATSTADPLAGLTADQVAAKVIATAKAAPSLTLNGSMTDSGATETIKFAIKPGQGCTGTAGTADKGSFKLTEIGDTTYLKPDKQFWETSAGSSASAVIALIDGRYIKLSPGDKSMQSLVSICDVSQMFSTDGKKDKLTRGKVTTLDGTRVLQLNDTTDGSMGYVTDTGEPQLVQFTGPKGSGKITVTYGAPVTLTPPPSSQVLDGAKIGL
jgi:hypothetical protein